MSGRPDYVGPQHAPYLVIAILIAGYVIMVLCAAWARKHKGTKTEDRAARDRALRKEIRRYPQESFWHDEE